MVRPPGDGEAPTALQHSPHAARTSKGSAIGSVVSAEACVASLHVDSTPDDHTRHLNAFRTPDTIEANILHGGRATCLYQKFGLDWVPGTMDPWLSALDQFGGSDPPTAIKKAMAKGPQSTGTSPRTFCSPSATTSRSTTSQTRLCWTSCLSLTGRASHV